MPFKHVPLAKAAFVMVFVFGLCVKNGCVAERRTGAAEPSGVGQWAGAQPLQAIKEGEEAGFPVMAMDRQGNALVLWFQGVRDSGSGWILFAVRYTAGTGWETPTAVSTGGSVNRGSASMAMDGQGNALVVWTEGDESAAVIRTNRYTTGSGWGTPRRVPTEEGSSLGSPDLAVDNKGNAVVVWRQKFEAAGAFSFDVWGVYYEHGVGWGEPELIDRESRTLAAPPRVVANDAGDAVAVWRKGSEARFDICASVFRAGVGWGAVEYVQKKPAEGGCCTLAMDGMGSAVVLWSQYERASVTMWANHWVRGEGWGAAQMIQVDDKGDAQSPSVAADATGNAMAVWRQDDGVWASVWAARYIQSVGWQKAERMESCIAGDADVPDVAVDERGNALAVWRQKKGVYEHIWASRYVAGEGWGAPEEIGFFEGSERAEDAERPHVRMDQSGNAIVVWRQFDGVRKRIWANGFRTCTSGKCGLHEQFR